MDLSQIYYREFEAKILRTFHLTHLQILSNPKFETSSENLIQPQTSLVGNQSPAHHANFSKQLSHPKDSIPTLQQLPPGESTDSGTYPENAKMFIWSFLYASWWNVFLESTKAEKGIPVPSLLEPLSVEMTEVRNGESRNRQNMMLRLDKDYTPFQIAQYVYQTGDEKGVSQLFIDMIQDGQSMVCIFKKVSNKTHVCYPDFQFSNTDNFQVSRDDMILFLENVQQELDRFRKSGAVS